MGAGINRHMEVPVFDVDTVFSEIEWAREPDYVRDRIMDLTAYGLSTFEADLLIMRIVRRMSYADMCDELGVKDRKRVQAWIGTAINNAVGATERAKKGAH